MTSPLILNFKIKLNDVNLMNKTSKSFREPGKLFLKTTLKTQESPAELSVKTFAQYIGYCISLYKIFTHVMVMDVL